MTCQICMDERCDGRHWFVGETVRYRQDEAALSVAPLGMEAYVPCIVRCRRRGHHIVEEEEPRFGTYIFVRFNRETDLWPSLIHGAWNKKLFTKFLTNTLGQPSPVPEIAMEAIMTYQPPRIGQAAPIEYQPGQRVACIISPGVRKDAVFVGYRGNTPMIEVWLLGREHTVPVTLAQLEPLDLDTARMQAQ